MSSADEYMAYLKRSARCDNRTLLELNQLALSREIAKEYGVTEEQLQELDEQLGVYCSNEECPYYARDSMCDAREGCAGYERAGREAE